MRTLLMTDDCRLLSDSDNVALEGSPFGPVMTSAHYSSRERTRTYLATSNLAWRRNRIDWLHDVSVKVFARYSREFTLITHSQNDPLNVMH